MWILQYLDQQKRDREMEREHPIHSEALRQHRPAESRRPGAYQDKSSGCECFEDMSRILHMNAGIHWESAGYSYFNLWVLCSDIFIRSFKFLYFHRLICLVLHKVRRRSLGGGQRQGWVNSPVHATAEGVQHFLAVSPVICVQHTPLFLGCMHSFVDQWPLIFEDAFICAAK